uniref:Uncharacterized protein n=1 Tax=Anguilla anguilla TaxID=7936 RepID=A0A0E9QFX3_ANGAN
MWSHNMPFDSVKIHGSISINDQTVIVATVTILQRVDTKQAWRSSPSVCFGKSHMIQM